MKNIKTFFEMFNQLMAIMNRRQKKQGIILFFLMLLVSVLEMLGVSVVIPFIIAMLDPENIMQNKYVKDIIGGFEIENYQVILFLIALSILIIYILKNLIILSVNYYQSNFRNQLDNDLSIKMLTSYMSRPYEFFLNTNSASILRGINSDTTNVSAVIDAFTSIIAEGLTCIIIGCFLLYLNPFMAISMLFIAGLTALSIIFGFKKKIAISGEVCRNAFEKKIKDANQAVNGIKEIILLNRRKYFINQYAEASSMAAIYNTKYLWISKQFKH